MVLEHSNGETNCFWDYTLSIQKRYLVTIEAFPAHMKRTYKQVLNIATLQTMLVTILIIIPLMNHFQVTSLLFRWVQKKGNVPLLGALILSETVQKHMSLLLSQNNLFYFSKPGRLECKVLGRNDSLVKTCFCSKNHLFMVWFYILFELITYFCIFCLVFIPSRWIFFCLQLARCM